jgi:nucleotide-binding universal stress UspA family protein
VRPVRPVPVGRSERGADVEPGTLTSLRLHSEALLTQAHELVHRVAPGVEVAEQLEVTNPRALLLGLATDAYLMVLGSHGRGPVLSRLLGSVGVGVVHNAACPVVVHRRGHPGRVHTGVVVAVDATEDSVPVLDFAFRQASLRRLPLRVVHYVMGPRPALVGVPLVGVPMVGVPMIDDAAELVDQDRLAVAELMAGFGERYPDVRTSVRTVRGMPALDVARTASRADLLVVGSHQRGAFGRLLAGSVSTAVLEHASCPVAVVPVRSS